MRKFFYDLRGHTVVNLSNGISAPFKRESTVIWILLGNEVQNPFTHAKSTWELGWDLFLRLFHCHVVWSSRSFILLIITLGNHWSYPFTLPLLRVLCSYGVSFLRSLFIHIVLLRIHDESSSAAGAPDASCLNARNFKVKSNKRIWGFFGLLVPQGFQENFITKHMYMYIYLYIDVHIHTYTSVCKFITYIYVCVYIYSYIYIHNEYIYISTCIYTSQMCAEYMFQITLYETGWKTTYFQNPPPHTHATWYSPTVFILHLA